MTLAIVTVVAFARGQSPSIALDTSGKLTQLTVARAWTLPKFNLPAAPVLPMTSLNGITGTWSPAVINMTVAGSTPYTFTPDAGQNAVPVELVIIVTDKQTPQFDLPDTIAVDAKIPELLKKSKNKIKGKWDQEKIDGSHPAEQSFTFTPRNTKKASPVTHKITVVATLIPWFEPLGTMYEGEPAPLLPAKSKNGIAGAWTPSSISTARAGNSNYTFKVNAGQHASNVTIPVVVLPKIKPVFPPVGPLLVNSGELVLPDQARNGITGSWEPAVVRTDEIGRFHYRFTPDPGQHAAPDAIDVDIEPNTAVGRAAVTARQVAPIVVPAVVPAGAPVIPIFKPMGPYLKTTEKDFPAQDAAIKVASRALLQDRMRSTLELLGRDNSDSLHHFYSLLWGEDVLQKMATELVALNDILSMGLAGPGGGLAFFKPLMKPLNGYLLSSSAFIYSVNQPAAGGKLELHRKAPLNQLLVDVYNGAGALPVKPVVTVDQYLRTMPYLRKQFDSANTLLKQFSQKADEKLLKEMEAFTRDMDNSQSVFSFVRRLFNRDWYKFWFCLRGGQLRLNPLDFNTDNFLAKAPQYDYSGCDAIFDTYIDSVIWKYQRFDTVGKVDAFRKILAQKANGKTLYGLKARLDTLMAANAPVQALYTIGDDLLNVVETPTKGREKARRDFFPYSATAGFSSRDSSKKYLRFPIRVDSTKHLVIFNIPAGAKVYLKENAKVIVDQSGFQTGVGDLSGLIAQSAGLFTQYATPLGSIASLLSPAINSPQTVTGIPSQPRDRFRSLALQPNRLSVTDKRYKDDDLATFPEHYLKDRGIYNKQIFDQARIPPEFSSKENKDRTFGTLAEGVDNDDRILAAETIFLERYMWLYGEWIRVIGGVKDKQLLLGNFIDIVAHSTLPVDKLAAISGKVPLYSTKILTTTPIDSATRQADTVFYVKGSDTSKLGQFIYRTGKTYTFQMSAGISYVAANFIQGKAALTNGQVVVNNTAQQYRFLVGLHVYPGGLFLQDNRFPGAVWHRLSVFLGVGFPNPLENVYPGLSYDLCPGFKATAGVYLYRNDAYTIQNDQIVEDRLKYKAAWPFFAIQIDPSALIKALGVSSK